jgi:hypothetical protein
MWNEYFLFSSTTILSASSDSNTPKATIAGSLCVGPFERIGGSIQPLQGSIVTAVTVTVRTIEPVPFAQVNVYERVEPAVNPDIVWLPFTLFPPDQEPEAAQLCA